MTITNTTNKVTYTGNDSTDTYAYTFKIFEDDDLVVSEILISTGAETVLVLNTDYTVTGAGNDNGGNVVLTAGNLASTKQLVIRRSIELTQETDYQENDDFPADTHEQALDKLTMQNQDQQEVIDRSVKIPAQTSGVDVELPAPAADKLLGWNSDADAIVNKVATDISSEVDITINSGDANKIVNVNSAENGYQLSTLTALYALITDLQAGGIFKFKKGSDVASAGALTLGDDGNFFDITGTTNITSITAKTAGTLVILQFDGVLTVTDGSNLNIRGNFVTAAESVIMLISDGTNWFEVARAGSFAALTASSITLASGATVTAVLDEDNMASDSATALATQQSIKKYVDDNTHGVDDTTIELSGGNVQVKDAGISQAKLKTSESEVSTTSATFVILTPASGQYGFYPQVKSNNAALAGNVVMVDNTNAIGTSYVTRIDVKSDGTNTLFAKFLYVTASGIDHWIFTLIHKASGKLIAAASAPDHPMYGNGGDISKVPHPFIGNDLTGLEVNILDKDTVNMLKNKVTLAKSILTILDEDFAVDTQQEKQYHPLHTGQFFNGAPVRINQLPAGIKVRGLKLRPGR